MDAATQIGIAGSQVPGNIGYWHPEYTARRWWWELARVSYVGGREYLQPSWLQIDFQEPISNTVVDASSGTPIEKQIYGTRTTQYPCLLHRFVREGLAEYENRRTRADYRNVFAPTLNSLAAHSIVEAPSRTGDAQLTEFWEKCDRKREISMDRFVSTTLPWVLAYGHVIPFMDQKPEAQGGDGKPYIYWVSPLDIIDWQVDDDGEYRWVKQFIYAEMERTWDKPLERRNRYRVWSRDEIVEFETGQSGDGQHEIKGSRRPNALGKVPIIPFWLRQNPDTPQPDGIPFGIDLAKGCNRLFNLGSLLDQILYEQTFSILTIPAGNVNKVEVATNRALGYNPERSGNGAQYIAPDPEQARVLMEAAGAALEELRQRAGVGRGRSETSKQRQSADAAELESEGEKTILHDIVDAAEDWERRVVQMFDAYRGRAADSDTKAEVIYQRKFDLGSLQGELAEILSWKAVGASPDVQQRLLQDAVKRKFASLPREERERLASTITAESMQPPEPEPEAGEDGDASRARKPGQGNGPPAARPANGTRGRFPNAGGQRQPQQAPG